LDAGLIACVHSETQDVAGVLQSAASQQHLIHGHWHCPGLRLACNAQAGLVRAQVEHMTTKVW